MQIAREIFLNQLTVMKKLLDLLAFKMDMRTNDYKYVKSQIMGYVYEGLQKLFKQLSDEKIIEKCPKKHNLRQGFKKCLCGGSGWINVIKENK